MTQRASNGLACSTHAEEEILAGFLTFCSTSGEYMSRQIRTRPAEEGASGQQCAHLLGGVLGADGAALGRGDAVVHGALGLQHARQ